MTNKQNNENLIYMDFDKAFSTTKKKIDDALNSSPSIIRDYMNHLGKTKGKFIRAKSILYCAKNNEGLISNEAIKAASAVEIIHLATLVHDDVIDNADTRRGNITLQRKYGVRTAVICGDFLLSLALKMVSSISNNKDYLSGKIPNYISRLCLGELTQHINNGNYNLSVYKYLKILSGKTAALFEASFFIGAAMIEKDISIIKKYAKIGHYIGMVFQLTDDCMDFEATENTAKKPVHSDYEQNVITLPLIHAFNELNGLRKKAMNNTLTRKDINKAVLTTGGIRRTRTLAKKYQTKATNLLNQIDMPEEKRKNIQLIINKSYREF